MRTHRSIPLIVAAAIACTGESRPATDTALTQTPDSATATTAERVGETPGMDVPESVRYDAELDLYYVSNIAGNPSQKDNNGFIAVVHPDSLGSVRMLVRGGEKGVTLHAPKGMALSGDTLWVADIDMLRGFDRRTGARLAEVSLAPQQATFLNDVAMGPDGVYITDTGIVFDASGGMSHPGVNRIFRVAGGRVTEVAKGDSLGNPNGIAWDGANNRWILAPFGGMEVQTFSAGASAPVQLVSGPGQYDGVEIVGDGMIAVSSWADSTVHLIRSGATSMQPLIRGVEAPADIGYDSRRRIIAVPRFNAGKVEFFRLP
jgi:sugar lactone lactonase YvrE